MKPKTLFVLLAACSAVAVLTACGDDDDTPAPTMTAEATQPSTPSATATPTPTGQNGDSGPDDPAHPASTRTGVTTLDTAIDAVLSGDFANVRPLLVPLKVACATEPSGGAPQPPRCPADVSGGTLVDVFPVGGPEGSYTLISEAESAFTAFLESGPRLFAAYRVTAASEPDWPGGTYGLVFVGSGQVRGVDLRLSDEGIVNINYGGGPTNPAAFTNPVPTEDFIVSAAK